MTFCVAQATFGLLKLTLPGKVHRWSFQTLQCVALKNRQFGLNFGPTFVWQVIKLRPVPTLAAALHIKHLYLRFGHQAEEINTCITVMYYTAHDRRHANSQSSNSRPGPYYSIGSAQPVQYHTTWIDRTLTSNT